MMAKNENKPSVVHRVKDKLRSNQETGSRKAILEDLFYDFNRSRVQIYKMNFVRGILFGAGSVIGGTVVIALIIWILSILSNVIPPLGDFFQGISSVLQPTKDT